MLAAGEDPALVEHRDRGVQDPDELHVVLHDHHGRVDGERADQIHRAQGLLTAHPRGRLVEQDDDRLAGHDHADLQPLVLAVRQRAGVLLRPGRQTQPGKDPMCPLARCPGIPKPGVTGQPDVFVRRQEGRR